MTNMQSTTLRRPAAREQASSIDYAIGHCSLGSFLVAATGQGLCAILIGDDRAALLDDLAARFPDARLSEADRRLAELRSTVGSMIDDPAVPARAPLRFDMRGTEFQQRVWNALREIPPGQTTSYAEVARRIGAPGSARAVAKACGANPLAVLVPCHRVVRSDGGLSGYRWGVERKRMLLAQERQ